MVPHRGADGRIPGHSSRVDLEAVAGERGLTVGCVAQGTALWRGLRDESGELVDLALVEADEGFAVWLGMPPARVDERT